MPWQYQASESFDSPEERHQDFVRITDARSNHLRLLGWVSLPKPQEGLLEAELQSRFPRADGATPPVPNATWDVSSAYSTPSQFNNLETNLNLNTLLAIRRCVPTGERVFAVDWQHDWYSFDPHGLATNGNPYDWAVPILPDGDCFMFFPSDFRFGIYSFPHTSIFVFGQELLDAFDSHRPTLFCNQIQWSNGLLSPKP